jgi:hypothetical protein
MNNVRQKNKILETRRYSGLPYRYGDNISYNFSQNVNFSNINNSLKQLLDNDLYVENAIRDYAGTVIGPKSASDSEISNAPDGFKVMRDDGTDFRVYRKKENPFGTEVREVVSGQKVVFSAFFRDSLFVGTENSVIRVDRDGNKTVFIDCGANSYEIQGETAFFATKDGIYRTFFEGDGISAKKIGGSGEYFAVHFEKNTKTLFSGTRTGVFEADYDGYSDHSGIFKYVPLKLSDVGDDAEAKVFKIMPMGNDVAAFTSKGVFLRRKGWEYDNYRTVLNGQFPRFQVSGDDTVVIVARPRLNEPETDVYVTDFDYSDPKKVVRGEKISANCGTYADCAYFGCDNGVYKLLGNQICKHFDKLPENFTVKSMDSTVLNGRTYLFLASETEIYVLDDVFSLSKVLSDNNIRDLAVVGNKLYYVTETSAYSAVFVQKESEKTPFISDFDPISRVESVIPDKIEKIFDNYGNMVVQTRGYLYDLSKNKKYSVGSRKILDSFPFRGEILVLTEKKATVLNGDPEKSDYLKVFGDFTGFQGGEKLIGMAKTENFVFIMTD